MKIRMSIFFIKIIDYKLRKLKCNIIIFILIGLNYKNIKIIYTIKSLNFIRDQVINRLIYLSID
jgi:hypothetical protein